VYLDQIGLAGQKEDLQAHVLFIALGVLLPSMHQASLGSMLVVFGSQVNPLWRSGYMMPLEYLMTAVCWALRRRGRGDPGRGWLQAALETALLAKLAKFIWACCWPTCRAHRSLSCAVRLPMPSKPRCKVSVSGGDDQLHHALVMLARIADRNNPGRLFGAATLLMLGGFMLRLNGYLVGYDKGEGWHYLPSLPELTITIGFIAFEILAYTSWSGSCRYFLRFQAGFPKS